MKLFNVIILWDVQVVAESEDAARDAVKEFIEQGELPASEAKAFESKETYNIRHAWQDQRPLVAGDVSDQDFERCKGKTAIEVQDMIYRRGQKGK